MGLAVEKQLVVAVQLVLGHLAIRRDDSGESASHTLDEFETCPGAPHTFELLLEPVQAGGADVLELLHAVPEIFK